MTIIRYESSAIVVRTVQAGISDSGVSKIYLSYIKTVHRHTVCDGVIVVLFLLLSDPFISCYGTYISYFLQCLCQLHRQY